MIFLHFWDFFTPILWNDSQLPQIFSKIYNFLVTKIFVNKKFLIFRGIEESSRQNRVKKIPKIMKNHEISQFLPNNLRSPSGCNFLKILILKHDFNYSYCPIEGFILIFYLCQTIKVYKSYQKVRFNLGDPVYLLERVAPKLNIFSTL